MILEVLIGIILIYLVIALIIIAQVNVARDYPKKTMFADEQAINSGDILGVGYHHVFGYFITGWSGSIWSHTGIAWKSKEGQLYVLEAANYGKKYNGIIRIPFAVWMRINRKSQICILKHSGKPFPAAELSSTFDQHAKCSLDHYNFGWYRFLCSLPYSGEKKDSYTCYELTVRVLQQIGVVKQDRACSSYFPREIMAGCMNMCSDHRYSEAIRLEPIEIPL